MFLHGMHVWWGPKGVGGGGGEGGWVGGRGALEELKEGCVGFWGDRMGCQEWCGERWGLSSWRRYGCVCWCESLGDLRVDIWATVSLGILSGMG